MFERVGSETSRLTPPRLVRMALTIARVHLIALLLGATVYAVAGTHYRAVTGLQGLIPRAGINATVKTLKTRSLIPCGIQCQQEPRCGAIFYSKAAENCYLVNKRPTFDQLEEDASAVCLSRPKGKLNLPRKEFYLGKWWSSRLMVILTNTSK